MGGIFIRTIQPPDVDIDNVVGGDGIQSSDYYFFTKIQCRRRWMKRYFKCSKASSVYFQVYYGFCGARFEKLSMVRWRNSTAAPQLLPYNLTNPQFIFDLHLNKCCSTSAMHENGEWSAGVPVLYDYKCRRRSI